MADRPRSVSGIADLGELDPLYLAARVLPTPHVALDGAGIGGEVAQDECLLRAESSRANPLLSRRRPAESGY